MYWSIWLLMLPCQRSVKCLGSDFPFVRWVYSDFHRGSCLRRGWCQWSLEGLGIRMIMSPYVFFNFSLDSLRKLSPAKSIYPTIGILQPVGSPRKRKKYLKFWRRWCNSVCRLKIPAGRLPFVGKCSVLASSKHGPSSKWNSVIFCKY